MVRIISSPRAGLDLVEAGGELIAETARFNAWVLGRKARVSDSVEFDDPDMPEELRGW